jgi:type VI secretion system protein ImpL
LLKLLQFKLPSRVFALPAPSTAAKESMSATR